MKTASHKKNIHHGHNVRLARMWKNLTQAELGIYLDMIQSQISDIEAKPVLEDKILDKIAKAMNVPVDFFKEFSPEETMKQFIANDNSFSTSSGENSKEVVTQSNIVEEQTNNYSYPIDDIKELYKQLLEEKDKQIARFEQKIKKLETKIDQLAKK